MKKTLKSWQIGGFIFTGLLGVFLHYLYDWTGQNVIAALFSAVNESIWEHLKLLFFPMLAYALIESRYIGRDYKNFWCVKLLGIVSGLVMIVVLYYTINGVLGGTPDWVNIAIFFVSTAFTYYLETLLLNGGYIKCNSPKKAILILILIGVVFAVFTFIPPNIPLFEDPITKQFGI